MLVQALRKNFGLKVLSLGVALTAWAYFHFSAAPSMTAHFDQQLTVPIVVSGLQPGFAAEYDEHTALLTVESPRSGAPIKADQVEAVLDVADRSSPGIVNVPVKVVAPDLVVKSLSPASVTLVLDRIATRSIPVSIVYRGGSGGLVVVSSSVSPNVTSVRGIASDLAKVASVRIEIPLGGSRPGVFDAMLRPFAADARGELVPGLDVSPNLVRVQARFAAATNSAGIKS